MACDLKGKTTHNLSKNNNNKLKKLYFPKHEIMGIVWKGLKKNQHPYYKTATVVLVPLRNHINTQFKL